MSLCHVMLSSQSGGSAVSQSQPMAGCCSEKCSRLFIACSQRDMQQAVDNCHLGECCNVDVDVHATGGMQFEVIR